MWYKITDRVKARHILEALEPGDEITGHDGEIIVVQGADRSAHGSEIAVFGVEFEFGVDDDIIYETDRRLTLSDLIGMEVKA